jgi:ElaB/YqjD/DUF883 family membrane-anchored ribosome-binding protein
MMTPEQIQSYADALPGHRPELDHWRDDVLAQAEQELAGAAGNLEEVLKQQGVDTSFDLGAAKPFADAAVAAVRGDPDSGQKILQAGAASVCLAATAASAGLASPACLVAGAVAAFAAPVAEALADFFGQKTLPPSLVKTPPLVPGTEPLTAGEFVTVINATEELRRREQNVVATLGNAYARTWRSVMGREPTPAEVVTAVVGALSRGGYDWDLVHSLPSYQDAAIEQDVARWQREGQTRDWIQYAADTQRAACQDPQLVVTCAPGNDLWRRVEAPPEHTRDRANAREVLSEVRARLERLPSAVVRATGEIARMVAEDAARAWQAEHGGMTPAEWNTAQLAAMARAGEASKIASEGAYGAFEQVFRSSHGDMTPLEWGEGVTSGEVDPEDYPGTSYEDGAPGGSWDQYFEQQRETEMNIPSDDYGVEGGVPVKRELPPVELGGPLDTTGASSGGSVAGPLILLGAGFLTLIVLVSRKGR